MQGTKGSEVVYGYVYHTCINMRIIKRIKKYFLNEE